MPLRAIINNVEVISSFLTKEEWIELKGQINSDSLEVIIAQTRKKGYLRTSKNGLNHFVHKKGEKPENWKPESSQHLYIKNQVLLGCKDAGWSSKSEFIENNWIADVFATKGKLRIAFEVQWSPQSYERTLERQEKYKDDDVRCCWLFKKVPKEFIYWENELKSNKEIPLFKLKEKKNKEIVIDFNGFEFKIRTFVKILLDGKIKFSKSIKSKFKQNISIFLFKTNCWKCGELQYSYFIQEYVESKCGLEIDIEHQMWNEYDENPEDELKFNPQIIKAINEFKKTEVGKEIKIGQIKKRYSKTVNSSYKSFGCYKCDSIFGDWYLNTEIMESKMYESYIEIKTEIELNEIIREKEHWCFNEKNEYCF